MCGICACICSDDSGDAFQNVSHIIQHLHHRGPDANGLWTSKCKNVALGHTRLSIIDVSPEASQPMQFSSLGITISFNGEIYNYKSLRLELVKKGYEFQTESDTEVFLKMYLEYGMEMLKQFSGMFAFIIWDSRVNKLICGRDPLGIKPLYYAKIKKSIVFSSTVKSIKNIFESEINPNEISLESFRLFGHVLGNNTIYQEIMSVPAGTYAEVNINGNINLINYCELYSILGQHDRVGLLPDDDLLKAMTIETVKNHMVSDVPFAFLLSSGVDSTVLLSAAREITDAPLNALTIVFEDFHGSDNDESGSAAVIAAELGVNHHIRRVSNAEVRDDLNQFLAYMDQPTTDGLNTWFASKFASELGYKVIISGVGGDELFGGYPSFKIIPAIYELFNYIRNLKGVPWIAAQTLKITFLIGLVKNYKITLLALCSSSVDHLWGLFRALDGHDFSKNVTFIDKFSNDYKVQNRSNFETIQILEYENYLLPKLLRDADWASMAHSVELRAPFVEYSYIRSVLSTFGNSLRKKNLIKLIPTKNVRRIVSRKKKGFQVPVFSIVNGVDVCGNNEITSKTWADFVLSRYLAGNG